MLQTKISIPIHLNNEVFTLDIFPEHDNSLFQIEEIEANEYGEAPFQILEGKAYEYQFTNHNYKLKTTIEGVVFESKRESFSGRILPNIYVGTLTLFVVHKNNAEVESKIFIEVLSSKFDTIDIGYRVNYRFMLKSITEKCTELLMQINSPTHQNFEPDFEKSNETIYQRFSFINSIIQTNEFNESIQKIISNPKTSWIEDEEIKDIRRIKRFSNNSIKQLTRNSNRIPLENHYLNNHSLYSIPTQIISTRNIEIIDNPENRFIKHSLQVYLKFCQECRRKFTKNSRAQKEVDNAIYILENYLNQSFFSDISRPQTLKLNSPVLQRKSGYREILKSWLMFDLASKLIWKGGEDVYSAGKRDIATLYEYWLFFTLYDLLKVKFNFDKIEHKDQLYNHLIEETKDGLNVMLKSGKHTALQGVCDFGSRKLNINFSYNRSFQGGKKYNDKLVGSWTSTLRPDYTLTFWPADLKENEAEKLEQIVHIHFDAKYKVSYFFIDLKEDSENESKKEERKGNYKNIDLLKMHAYKDAIRRTGGAYILYPGTEEKIYRGFHELIPGLGAFAIKPSEGINGIKEIEVFIDDIIKNLLDRTSQRENLSSKVYDIFKDDKSDNEFLHDSFPEFYEKAKIIPDDVSVLVGYYKSDEHLKWILENNLYNFRTGTDKGSLPLHEVNINAKYLILHGKNEVTTNKIYQLKPNGLKIFSHKDLMKKKYPNPKGELYLVYEIEKDISSEFNNVIIDIRKLPKFENNRNSAKPITSTLTEVLKAKIIEL